MEAYTSTLNQQTESLTDSLADSLTDSLICPHNALGSFLKLVPGIWACFLNGKPFNPLLLLAASLPYMLTFHTYIHTQIHTHLTI